jgi:hypothetical protein
LSFVDPVAQVGDDFDESWSRLHIDS